MKLVDGVQSVLWSLTLVPQVGDVELTLLDVRLLQRALDLRGLSVLLPVVDLDLFLHHVVLLGIPHRVISGFDPRGLSRVADSRSLPSTSTQSLPLYLLLYYLMRAAKSSSAA